MLTKIFKFWLPPIIWGAIIFSGSSVSTPSFSKIYWQDFAIHKTAHIIEYAILGVLIYRAIVQEKVSKKEAIIYAIIVAAFYGFTDEFHQSFTPGRVTRFRDVFFDTIGASIGIFIVWKLLPKAPKKLLTLAKKLDLL